MISLDTLRADHLGPYGYERRQTSPNLDRLARDSIVFERHVASSPWTTPSHMTLLTSLSPSAHGVTSDFGALRVGFRGLARVARLPDERTTLAEVLADAGWRTAAFTGGVTMDPALGFAQGFARYETEFAKLNSRRLQQLQDWLESDAAPYFLFLHTFEVHAPYLRTRFIDEVLDARRAQLLDRRLARLAQEPGWKSVERAEGIMKRLGAFSPEVADALYDGGIWHADRWLGELFGWMRQRGLYDRTLIVVSSDHGEQLGERDGGFYDSHGHTLYEEMLRIPLIVKLPGQRRGGERISRFSRAIDVMPTVLEQLGAVPGRHEMEGRALLSETAAGSASAPPALSEALSRPFEAKSIRDARYKLIVGFEEKAVRETGREEIPAEGLVRELYDLMRDPRERANLLEAPVPPEQAARAEAMERALRERLASIRGRADRITLGPAVLERLRALGYVK